VPGLGTSFGRGGATDYLGDLQHSDCIVIMGSNMAEQHPVGFQWVMEARERGAKVIHVDPRFTRTSAMSTQWVGIRPGSDIAFLGGIIRHILETGSYFEEYVKAYTNAPVIIEKAYRDTEDLDGLFSGWDPEEGWYDVSSWQYAGLKVHPASEQRRGPGGRERHVGSAEVHGAAGAQLSDWKAPREDPTLEDPNCVFQILRRHYERYTPEMVAEACGCTAEQFLEVADALCQNSGRERTSAFCYAVGWTQHTVGVQIIRAASIVQLLLGNIGRPGGGIVALRGHASIQGSTDIPTLYNLLPGYLPMPHAGPYDDLAGYVETNRSPGGWWGHMQEFTVSLLKAWFGAHAVPANDYCFGYLPRIDEDHSVYQWPRFVKEGKLKGMLVAGENPAVGSANGRAQRHMLAGLDWLVVRDCIETETAAFWYDSPEVESGEASPETIGTEVFFMPAATHTEKDGSFTNTQRLVQWHYKATEPKHDCRSELWFYYWLGRRLKERLSSSQEPRDRPIRDLTWDYPTASGTHEPNAEWVLREISGFEPDTGEALETYERLKGDGGTACGCWIYCGIYKDNVNQAARRKPHWEQSYVAPEWAWAWPDNRRLLYNRASADPEGKPWSARKAYVWWDEEQSLWRGYDKPDTDPTKAPSYRPPKDAQDELAIAGDKPFGMQADGRGWLFVPLGVEDGPLPTHYEPQESPVPNPLYGQDANPRRQELVDFDNPYNPAHDEPGADAFPFVLTTYRLTEHHCAGGFTRSVPYLAELQPAFFVEVHPDLARLRDLRNGDWATISTARSAVEARVLVTDRIRPLRVRGRTVHQVGLPFHWGKRGLTTGDSANDLTHMAIDPNVHIQEVKALTCDIRPGRRPAGAGLAAAVSELRKKGVERRAAQPTRSTK
jgi:formate dehydrogenase major subunit